ncbi:MAG: glycosyltransferase family 39 protein [Desulfarculaceae bacterium]
MSVPGFSRLLYYLIMVCLTAMGAAAFIVAAQSYPVVTGWLEAFSADGRVDDIFTLAKFQGIALNLRLGGALLLALTAAGLIWRQRAIQLLQAQVDSLASGWRLLRQEISQGLQKDSALHLTALALVILGGAVLRLVYINQPIRYDEALSYLNFASKPVIVGLSWYPEPNNHVFHNLLVHISTALLGEGLWAIRLPAFVAGVLTIPAAYLLCRYLYGKNAALLCAGLTASSSFLIEFSTNARGYTICTLLFLLMAGLMAWVREHREPAAWSLWAIMAALGLWTHPTMAFALASLGIWWILSASPWRQDGWQNLQLKAFLGACLGTLILSAFLYLPVIIISGWRALLANEVIARSRYLQGFVQRLPVIWEQWNRDLPLAAKFVATAGFLAAVIWHRRLARRMACLGLAAAIGCGLFLVLQGTTPPTRTWQFLVPVYWALAAAGIAWPLRVLFTARRGRQALFALLAVLITLVMWVATYRSQSVLRSELTGTMRQAGEVAEYLGRHIKPGDRVASTHPSSFPLTYNLKIRGLPLGVMTTSRDQLRASPRFWLPLTHIQAGPEQVLRQSGLDPGSEFGPPRLMLKLGQARLYLIEKQKQSGPGKK